MSEPKIDVKDFMQAISSLVDKDMFNNLVNQIDQEEVDEEAILNDEKVLASLPNIEIIISRASQIKNFSQNKTLINTNINSIDFKNLDI